MRQLILGTLLFASTIAFAAPVNKKAQGPGSPATASAQATAAAASAQPTAAKMYQDPKNHYQLTYPGNWMQQNLEKGKDTPSLAVFAKPDQSVMVNVMIAKNDSRNSALGFLSQMDQSRKATNKLPEDQRKLAAEVLKKTAADEGARGVYEFPGKKPVMQRTLVLKRKSEIFVLTATFQKAHEQADAPAVEAVLASFQFVSGKAQK